MKRVLLPYREPLKVAAYEDAVRAAHLEPARVLPEDQPTLEGFDGLLLTGGSDVDPGCYGERPHPATEMPDPMRDGEEIRLIRGALARDLPIFAICRGLQILNVALGGTLIQDLPQASRHVHRTEDRSLPAHDIEIESGSRLQAILDTDQASVNSRHHQAIKHLGDKLRATAWDIDDRTVEAIEGDDQRFLLAVQWHPEDEVFAFPQRLRLFNAFADAL